MNRLGKIKAYYEQRYGSGDLGMSMRSPESYEPFLEWLEIQPGQQLLDVGCGSGSLLSNKDLISDPWGIDLSEYAVRIASNRNTNANLCVADMQNMPFPNGFFDKVVNIGGLEHVPDMEKALYEMKRICDKDGKLCIVVPNKDFLLYVLLPIQGTEQSAMEEHLKTLHEWVDLLYEAGLEIIQIKPDPGPLIRNDLGIKTFFRGIMRRLVLKFISVLNIKYTYQFTFICKK